jgi:hypothetical protein
MIKKLLQLGSVRVKRLNIGPVPGRVSGSVSIRQFFEEGSVTKYYGCRYAGAAVEKAAALMPGDLIEILDGGFEEVTSRDGSTWTCLNILDFEKVEQKY